MVLEMSSKGWLDSRIERRAKLIDVLLKLFFTLARQITAKKYFTSMTYINKATVLPGRLLRMY